jgi:cyclic pyranopterin phosphate synthase
VSVDEHPEATARMVDVTDKQVTARTATASGRIVLSDETRAAIAQRRVPKGDVLEVARVAGIMGAKKTSELIPLCHPLAIGSVDVEFAEVEDGFQVTATVRTNDRTGVEMEALTAVMTAALTVYDMVKGIDRSAHITAVRLEAKSGGKSGDWRREPA